MKLLIAPPKTLATSTALRLVASAKLIIFGKLVTNHPASKAPLISIILPKKLLVLPLVILDGALLTPSAVVASAASSDSFLLTADLLWRKREFFLKMDSFLNLFLCKIEELTLPADFWALFKLCLKEPTDLLMVEVLIDDLIAILSYHIINSL